jgi:hypothetical protein
MAHRSNIEVDQSIRIEMIGEPTILAFSNDEEYSIVISPEAKHAGLDALRKKKIAPRHITLRLFASALFLLLKEHLAHVALIYIDLEYQGHDNEIRTMLLRLIRQNDPFFSPEQIIFKRVGKESRAHRKAWSVQVGKVKADRKISRDEFLRAVK